MLLQCCQNSWIGLPVAWRWRRKRTRTRVKNMSGVLLGSGPAIDQPKFLVCGRIVGLAGEHVDDRSSAALLCPSRAEAPPLCSPKLRWFFLDIATCTAMQ